MYIRKQIYKLKDGTPRVNYGLLETKRVRGMPQQKTILNLGQDFDVPESQWPTLCRHVERALRGQSVMRLEDEHLIDAADAIARRLREKGYDINAKRDERDAVIADLVSHLDVRTVGGERIGLQALEQLGFAAVLRSLGMAEDDIRMATALVVGRMLSPGSEAHVYRWMMETSAVFELLDLEAPSESTLFRVGDRLFELRMAILDGLFGNMREHLGSSDTLLLCDLTHAFETGPADDELLFYGLRAEEDEEGLLDMVAMMMDASGLLRNMRVLPADVSVPDMLRQATETLGNTDATVIMDAGIATQANVAYLNEKGHHWIGIHRGQTPPAPNRTPDDTWRTSDGSLIRVWRRAQQDDEQRVQLQCDAQPATDADVLAEQCAKFEAALQSLHEGLSTPYRLKDYVKVLRRVGTLEEQYKRVSYQYDVDVLEAKDSTHAKAVVFTHVSAYERGTWVNGGFILRTSRIDWPAARVARTYWRLADVKSTLRAIHSDMDVHPLHHSEDQRLEADLFVSVLAGRAVRHIRTKLKKIGLNSSWETLRIELSRWRRITTLLPKGRGTYIQLKNDTDLSPLLRRIALTMGLKPDRHTSRKRIRRP